MRASGAARAVLTLTAGLVLTGWGDLANAQGHTEINQARMNAGGITAGDAPGPPVTISVQGSYLFTSDLLTSDPNQDVIVIQADHVTIDMNGFKIQGPTTCVQPSYTPPGQPQTICSNTGTGRGITDGGSPRVAILIEDGKLTGLGSHCIDLGATHFARTDNVHCDQAGGSGMLTGLYANLKHSWCYLAGGGCIVGGDYSRVRYSSATNSGGVGIQVGLYSSLNEVEAQGNASHGFVMGSGSFGTVMIGSANGGSGASLKCGGTRLQDSTFDLNFQFGVDFNLGLGATVDDCSARNVSTSGNGAAGAASLATNVALALDALFSVGNGGEGLFTPAMCFAGSSPCATLRNSDFAGNAMGATINGSFVEAPAGSNTCNGAASCP